MAKKTFYRLAHDLTEQGMWYDKYGNFKGLIHNHVFSFCKNKDLQMPFDPDVVGWLSATQTIEELFLWFPVPDVERLEDFGFFITKYDAENYREYKNHWLIEQSTSEVNENIPLKSLATLTY